MPHRLHRSIPTVLSLVVALMLAFSGILARPSGQSSLPAQNQDGNWAYYGGNTKNWKYRPFDQINASNFSKLQVTWRFKTDNMGRQPEFRLGATPLMVNGVVYAVGGGMRRSVAALEADTGAMLR
jgi:glucose dehydrogenase